MDAIALLCTLHAEGPMTLKRLRQAGCVTLSELDAFESEKLAGILDTSAAGARRFKREARVLMQRLGPGILEPEEETPARAWQHPRTPVTSGVHASHAENGPPLPGPVAGGPVLDEAARLRERELVGRVLDRWREKDERDALASPASSTAGSTAVPSLLMPGSVPGPVHSDTGQPAQGRDLTTVNLTGLDEPAMRTLAAAGVRTVEELADLEEEAILELGAAGLGYTRCVRLRSLARELGESSGLPGSSGSHGSHGSDTAPGQKFSVSEHPASGDLQPPHIDWSMELRPRAPKDARETQEVRRDRSQDRENAGGPFA